MPTYDPTEHEDATDERVRDAMLRGMLTGVIRYRNANVNESPDRPHALRLNPEDLQRIREYFGGDPPRPGSVPTLLGVYLFPDHDLPRLNAVRMSEKELAVWREGRCRVCTSGRCAPDRPSARSNSSRRSAALRSTGR